MPEIDWLYEMDASSLPCLIYCIYLLSAPSVRIALVGFAASLATLAAVVVQSSKTLQNLGGMLKVATEHVSRLL